MFDFLKNGKIIDFTKKSINLLLAMLIILSSLVCVNFTTNADIPSNKTMLHIVRTNANAAKIAKRVAGTLESNVEYTASFNYSFNSRELNDGIFVYLMGADSEDNIALICSGDPNRADKKFLSSNVGSTSATYTFKLDDASQYANYYIGFSFESGSANPDFYIGDFVVYKSSDANKTDVLGEKSDATVLENWYNHNVGNKAYRLIKATNSEWVGTGYEAYDETLFAPQKTMLHIVRTNANAAKIAKRVAGTLESNVEYTASFNYSFNSRELNDGIFVYLMGADSEDNIALICSGDPNRADKKFLSSNVGSTSATYTFKLDDASQYANYYIGFSFESGSANPDFYIGDFVVYKSSDANKTDVLGEKSDATVLENWYNHNVGNKAYRLIKATNSEWVGTGYEKYDSEVFKNYERMLHIKSSAGVIDTFMQEIPIDDMVLGEQYTASFQHEYLSGALNENVYFCIFGANNGTQRNWTDVIYSTSALGEAFQVPEQLAGEADTIRALSRKVLNVDPQFTFSIDEKKYDKYYIGFYFAGTEKPVDFYVARLNLYKTSDTSKTSILKCNFKNCDMTDWYNSYSRGTASDKFGDSMLEEYDRKTFEDKTGNVKTMLRIARTHDRNNKLYVEIEKSKIEADVEYVATFNSRFTSRAMNDGIRFTLARASYDDEGKIVRNGIYSSYLGTEFNISGYSNGTVGEYRFSISKGQWDQSDMFLLGLGFEDGETDAIGYFANFTLYRADDPTKTNLLSKDQYSTDMYRYHNDSVAANKGASIFQECYYIPYDDRVFDKALSVSGDHKAGEKVVAKVSKDDLIAGKEYGLSVNYNFGLSKLNEDISFALFGDKNAGDGVYADTVIFGGKDGTFASSSAGKSDITYKFKMTNEILNKYEDFYIGIYFVKDVKNADIHIGDLTLYETVNPIEKAFEQDRYPTNMKGWYTSNINIDVEGSKTVKYEYYDGRYFPKYTFSEINDGEWWSDEDISDIKVDTATIKGKVTFVSGEIADNIKVTIYSNIGEYTAITDKNGKFTFTNIPIGIYNLYLTDAQGNRFDTYDIISPDADSIITLDITLNKKEAIVVPEPVGYIKGNVYTADLKPVANLKIMLRGFGETVTNKDGYFEFDSVPVGEYEVYTVLENGEEYIFKTIKINENVEVVTKLKYDPVKTVAAPDEGLSTATIIIIISIVVIVLAAAGVTVLILWRKKHKA